MKKVFSVLCVLCIIFATIHVHAEIKDNTINLNDATANEAAVKMNKLGIVIGTGTNSDGSINYNLGGNLTRAELVTTIVRAFGADQAAILAKGAPSFTDVSANAWYSGYVAVAKKLAEQAGTTLGRDANTFDPNANVSKAEALVYVMEFLGVKVDSTGANWYEAWIQEAITLGLISSEEASTIFHTPAAPASRGEAFIILDYGYSAKVLESGESLYTKYVDNIAPQLTIDGGYPETVYSETVTLTGRVSDNKDGVVVNSSPTTSHTTSKLSGMNGTWSITIPLKIGKNEIEIIATDLAGNSTSKKISIERVSIMDLNIIPYSVSIPVGIKYSFQAEVIGTNNKPLTNVPVSWSIENPDAFIDQQGNFIATKAGSYTIIATVKGLLRTATAYVYKPVPEPPPQPSISLKKFDDLVNVVGEDISIDLKFYVNVPSDTSTVKFSATGLPDGITIDNDRLVGEITTVAIGKHSVTVTAYANGYQPNSKTFTWTIGTNHPPVWLAIDEESNRLVLKNSIGKTTDLKDYVSDPDGDRLFFEEIDMHEDLQLSSDGILRFIGDELSDKYYITVRVWDREDSHDPIVLSADVTIELTITEYDDIN